MIRLTSALYSRLSNQPAIISRPLEAKKLNKKKLSLIVQDKDLAESRKSRRIAYNKRYIKSYLEVCVDVGQYERAISLVKIRTASPGKHSCLETSHFNTILNGIAKSNSSNKLEQVREVISIMSMNGINLDLTSYANIFLAYSESKFDQQISFQLRNVLSDLESSKFDKRKIFDNAYFSKNDQDKIRNVIKQVDPLFVNDYLDRAIKSNNQLLANIDMKPSNEYHFIEGIDTSQLNDWSQSQQVVELKDEIEIKSVAPFTNAKALYYNRLLNVYIDYWRESIAKTLTENLAILRKQCDKHKRTIHIYPYLCTLPQDVLIDLISTQVQIESANMNWSLSTRNLCFRFGQKYMRVAKLYRSIRSGSYEERIAIYDKYINTYCKNPVLMGQMNSREFIHYIAKQTSNYAPFEDILMDTAAWPQPVLMSIGRFCYNIILESIKFDPNSIKDNYKGIQKDKLVNVFYTAYQQQEKSYKIKQELLVHPDFERIHKASAHQVIKFEYSDLPTLSPPMPWITPHFGGYLIKTTDFLIADNSFYELYACDTKDSLQKLLPTFDALNALSLCPWIVNKEVLDLAINLFKNGGDEKLKIPLRKVAFSEIDSKPLPKQASSAERAVRFRDLRIQSQKSKDMYSLYCDCLYRLSIANHFRDRIFWFPHNFDFRGRTYPVPPHFNHLGADLARSLLLFARGRPLGQNGLDWLKLHCINLSGTMKRASIQERIDFANKAILDILDSADNPWDGRRWWTKNDNPWQVLACCKEIAKAIRSKDHTKYVSHLPIHQDGSCNGLQHYAALGRDKPGGAAVNLTPSDRPQDVYSTVVDIVEQKRQKHSLEGLSIAKKLEGFVKRKVIKQTVMTTVYGVTRYGARDQILRGLTKAGFPDEFVWQASAYLTKVTFESIGHIFERSTQIQNWLKKSAGIIGSKYNEPVSWETPLGFPVIQMYADRHVYSDFDLQARELKWIKKSLKPIGKLNLSKQKSAFPPNYIHSLDSTHMMLTSLYCQKAGLTFVSVHDCFWTHAQTAAKMNEICREQFVALHSMPLLSDLRDQFISFKKASRANNNEELFSKAPSTGDLDLNEVLKSRYFFS